MLIQRRNWAGRRWYSYVPAIVPAKQRRYDSHASDGAAASRAFPAVRRSQLHKSRWFNYGNDFTTQFPDPDTPLVPIARVASGPVHKVPGGASGLAFTIRIRDTLRRWYALALARGSVCWCRFVVEGGREVEVCRQSRLRGRIHARPSAGGLAALCASRFFLFHLAFSSSSSARPVPSRSSTNAPGRTWALGPPLDLPRLRSPPTRSSRTNPHSLGTIYNSLDIACKCNHRMRILASIHRIVNRLATI